MINKKEWISFIKEDRNRPRAALYYSACMPKNETKFLRVEGKSEGLIVCVGTEEKARIFLKNILFDIINVPEDFDICLIKELLSEGYYSNFDKVEGEWVLCRDQ